MKSIKIKKKKIVYMKLIISALYEFWKREYFISYFYDI